MRSLVEYFNELNSKNSIIPSSENNKMKPLKIVAPQNSIDEALWNSKKDKWSRNAKHPITSVDIIDVHTWEKGDHAIYEGQEVEITVTKRQNQTVGILLNGRTKMVKENRLKPLVEGVLGGLQSLEPLNRLMQLAGLQSQPMAEVIEPQEEAIIAEDDSTNMFNSLMQSNLSGEFKNNPNAAKVATIGQVLSALSSESASLSGQIDAATLTKINSAIGLGPALMQYAKSMTQPQQTTNTMPVAAQE
jgi:hypothetical protein